MVDMVVLFQVFQRACVSNLGSCFNSLNRIIMSYYAVAKGRSVGVYTTWADCEAQVKGFSGAKFKKFGSEEGAREYITTHASPSYGDAPHTKPAFNNNATASNYNLKRTYSTSSSNQQRGGKSNYSHPRKSNSKFQDDSEDDKSLSDDGLDAILNKQMDDIEKRVKSFEKGVDKIVKKSSGRSTILIEPPQPKKQRKDNDGFEVDNDGYVQVYTDGACSANGRSGARAGIGVYWGEGHPLNVSEPVSGRATNNCGEIQAATRALQQATQKCGLTKITINTDSKFLINSVTKWMPGWKRKGWKLASGEPVKNEEDFKELDSVLHKLDVKWNYVEAHRGVHGNERADQLAKAGAALYTKR